ncbi:DUF4892 domain-containing protein [Marinomonas pollencensis]|uniref:Uncharacterized protein DUF4892 n=1 Tax=Marinomonas pollencensis TaxID=491954 RepID=A0A3E0DTK3_9GAMM|nr:DUF4892 domain-containing protein [Marinomonas pollencensis]REG85793.1 uncharacterized protein DUF4892 [Marinomonas pollencensis]
MIRVKQVILACFALFVSYAFADITHVEAYRGAQLVKSETLDNQALEIPLGKIQRSGRGWEPESVLRVSGSVFRSLYKVERNVPLESVFAYYKSTLLADGQKVIFQCESRSCGSSNAWANNFFNNYLLYGADSTQLLMVVQDSHDDYQVIYINRRGAGDIMIRLDSIALMVAQDAEFEVAAQMAVNDFPRIRRFLRDLPNGQRVVGFVTSERGGGESAIAQGDRYIDALISAVGDQLSQQVRFINVADMGRDLLGKHRVSFVYVTP